jgi:dihydrofolate reductase
VGKFSGQCAEALTSAPRLRGLLIGVCRPANLATPNPLGQQMAREVDFQIRIDAGDPMELCLIWAQDMAGAIGRADMAPWKLPEDMVRFRDTTMGHPVIMGRRTWERIGGRPLQGRQNIVLLRENDDLNISGAVRAASIGDAIMLAGSGRPAKAFIIGGTDLHARALPVAQRLYVTEVDVELEAADTFAPAVPPALWMRHLETGLQASTAGLRYRFIEYRRAGRR